MAVLYDLLVAKAILYFWYGAKCCTELSAAMRVTSRIRTSHLLSPYICESYEDDSHYVQATRPMAIPHKLL